MLGDRVMASCRLETASLRYLKISKRSFGLFQTFGIPKQGYYVAPKRRDPCTQWCGFISYTKTGRQFYLILREGNHCVNPCNVPALLRLDSPSGPRPLRYWGFEITFRHTTPDRTPLDEWSASRRNLWQHIAFKTGRHLCLRRDFFFFLKHLTDLLKT